MYVSPSCRITRIYKRPRKRNGCKRKTKGIFGEYGAVVSLKGEGGGAMDGVETEVLRWTFWMDGVLSGEPVAKWLMVKGLEHSENK